MRKLIAFLLLFTLFLTSAVHIFAQERPDVLTLLKNDADGRFTTLLAAVDAAGLTESLKGAGPYTVLAPTNDAFAALLTQTGMTQEQLLADTANLKKIVLYHVIPGKYFYRQLTGGRTLSTGLAGQKVTFNLTGGKFTVNGAGLTDPDHLASNGLFDVIDTVLLPPDVQAALATPEATAASTETATAAPTEAATPEATAAPTAEAGVPVARPDLLTLLKNDADGRFTTLLAAINASGALGLVSGAGPYTLLAPTNDAFAALLTQTGMTQEQLLADKARLTKIVLYHLIPGQHFYRQLTGGPTLATELLGQSVEFNLSKGVFTVNGAKLTDPDHLASNGLFDVLDTVLLPPDVQAALATPEATAAPTNTPTTEPTATAANTATPVPTAAPTNTSTSEPTAVAGAPAERPDVLTLLKNDADGRFTTLLAAVDAAGLTESLKGAGPYTVLAPTNDAFAALLTQTGMTQEQLLADTANLKKIVLYHVIPGKYFYRQLTGGRTLSTGLAGQKVTFNLTGGKFTVNGAGLTDPDHLASNGLFDVIDTVLLPPDVQAALATPEATAASTETATAAPTEAATPEATAAPTAEAGVPVARPDLLTLLKNDADGRFTTLLAAINASGALGLVSGAGPYTLLAPTNDAFAALLTQTGMTQEQLLADKARLTKIVLYHLIPGQHFYRQLTGGPTLATELLGQSVEFNLSKGVFTVNGAKLTDPDHLASNGLFDVLDTVLLPPDVQAALATPEATAAPTETATPAPTEAATPEATAVAGVPAARPNLVALLQSDPGGRFTTLLAAVDAAGLTDTLSNGGPFTVLAPTNDAFAALLTQTGMTQDQLLADRTTLRKILLYHTVLGKAFYRQLTSGPTLPTALLGQSVKFDLTGGVFTVNGAKLTDPDHLASNGLFDVIDTVLLPPEVQTALATPEATAEPTSTPTPEATAVPTETPTPEATEAVNPGEAHMRFAQFSPDAGSINIVIDGQLSTVTNVSFGEVSEWLDLGPGTYAIGIAPTDGTATITTSVVLGENDWETVALIGSKASNSLHAAAFHENFSPLGAKNARLSVFNGVEGSPSYDVIATGKTLVVRLGYPGTLGNNDGFFSVDVVAGTYEVQFVVDGQQARVVADVKNVPLTAGTNYFIAVVGSPTDVKTVTATASVPTS